MDGIMLVLQLSSEALLKQLTLSQGTVQCVNKGIDPMINNGLRVWAYRR